MIENDLPKNLNINLLNINETHLYYRDGNLIKPGNVFVWGLGPENSPIGVTPDSEGDVRFPTLISSLKSIVHVFVSVGVNGAVSSSGQLYTWGKNYKYRLLQPIEDEVYFNPTLVNYFENQFIETIHFSETHSAVKLLNGNVYLWGDGADGCFGDGIDEHHLSKNPILAQTKDLIPLKVSQICLSSRSTMLLTYNGDIYVAGNNLTGKLSSNTQQFLYFTKIDLPPCRYISMGSIYSLVITFNNEVYSFGNGSFGNLGIGKRIKILTIPTLIKFPTEIPILKVAATIEQPLIKKMDLKEIQGNEGPTSFACTITGKVFSWGTSHKGKLGNCSKKVLCPENCDELLPYEIGTNSKDTNEITNYLKNEKIIQLISAHIHSCVLSDSGKLFSFGCGSNGRMGLDDFIKKNRKQRLKFYQSIPTPIETFIREKIFIWYASSAKNHMIAIGTKKII